MDLYEVISSLITKAGVTGHEYAAADVVEEYFRRYSDNVWRDTSGNVFCRIGEKKPSVMLIAHNDEIGMMVTGIEDNGMLRIRSVAGVDPRVLPGSEVVVHGKEALKAFIGAVPPHLIVGGTDAAYKMSDLLVDTGLLPEKVNELVSIGDIVTFALEEPLKLKNNVIAGKSLDDRALIACMLEVAEILEKRKIVGSVILCASTQEECSGPGAGVAAFSAEPDIAIVLDVTHAPQPGADPSSTIPLDKVGICVGGNIHPKVFSMLKAAASEANISYEIEVAMGFSGTDADFVQMTRYSIPTGLVSPPVKYMHTNVETMSLDTLKNVAKVVAEFIAGLGSDWEEKLCLDD
ncbi:MAG: M20/M25/M40 family metallo-hydrolase [Clostridia bacterium]|nr:M20/M25/M40 family metallo-hydrolase [Clostridia bacterium]